MDKKYVDSQAKKIRDDIAKESKRKKNWEKEVKDINKKLSPFERARNEYRDATNMFGQKGSKITKSHIDSLRKKAEDLYHKQNNTGK